MKNKSLIKIILSALAFASSISFSNAQSPEKDLLNSTPEQRAQRITEWMRVELELTPEQESAVHAINLKYAVQNESLKEDRGTKTSRQKKFKSRQEAKDVELKQSLTAEQFNTYLEKKDELKKKMNEAVTERRNK